MSKKKKIIILSCMVALLAVTAVLNYVFTNKTTTVDDAPTSTTAGYFAQYRSTRLTTRNEELLQLDDIISASAVDSQERADAIQLKTELTEITEKEMLLETLIKAYGFEDVVVVMSLTSENVNVIASSDEITPDDTIKIYTIIEEENIASPANVKIIPIS